MEETESRLPANLDGKSSFFVGAQGFLFTPQARQRPAVRYPLRPDPPGFSVPSSVQPARQNPTHLYYFVT
jgi:hypothetical protein